MTQHGELAMTQISDSSADQPVKRSKYLLFTSAGDAGCVNRWQSTAQEYDIWVYYYGDRKVTPLDEVADFFKRSKGGKFQNFYQCWCQYRSIIEQYEAVLLADDDIRISPQAINRLFALRRQQGFMALQPAFDPLGKISHPPTKMRFFSQWRNVNFIEVTFVLFETRALMGFMEEYSPEVNCHGVDWWFSYQFVNQYGESALAVVDAITCENPHDFIKDNGREISHIYSNQALDSTWKAFQQRRGIVTEKGTYKEFYRQASLSPWLFARQLAVYLRYQGMRLVRRLLRLMGKL